MATTYTLTTIAVDQRTGPICNNSGLRIRHERGPESVRQRTRELHNVLLDRLCDWIDTRPDHSNEGPAISIPAVLRDHMGTVGALVSPPNILSAEEQIRRGVGEDASSDLCLRAI